MEEKPECKRWQSEITSLRQGFRRVYETGELSDFTFTIRGDHEMKEFNVHKLVLASRSIKFQRMLLDPNAVNPHIVDNENITETGLRLLFRFIYTDDIGTEDRLSIIQAFIAAEYYQQVALQDLCNRKINSWTVTKEDVWQLLNAGMTVTVLKDKCLAFIKNNASDVIFHPSFLDISFGCLNIVLDSGVLKSVSALQRLKRIMEWAGKHYTNWKCVRNAFEKNGLLGKLEIEALTLEELRTVSKNYKDLLTPQEIVDFMDYTEDRDPKYLPSWCVPSS